LTARPILILTAMLDLTERLSADILHRAQMEAAPPASPTPGALHQPMPGGTGVNGGVRARMQQEDRARESGAR
jgi:hypothetical protein